jgi:hypothetical protein
MEKKRITIMDTILQVTRPIERRFKESVCECHQLPPDRCQYNNGGYHILLGFEKQVAITPPPLVFLNCFQTTFD